MSRQVAPETVLTFLNAFFSQLDLLCEKHRVMKVETAGGRQLHQWSLCCLII